MRGVVGSHVRLTRESAPQTLADRQVTSTAEPLTAALGSMRAALGKLRVKQLQARHSRRLRCRRSRCRCATVLTPLLDPRGLTLRDTAQAAKSKWGARGSVATTWGCAGVKGAAAVFAQPAAVGTGTAEARFYGRECADHAGAGLATASAPAPQAVTSKWGQRQPTAWATLSAPVVVVHSTPPDDNAGDTLPANLQQVPPPPPPPVLLQRRAEPLRSWAPVWTAQSVDTLEPAAGVGSDAPTAHKRTSDDADIQDGGTPRSGDSDMRGGALEPLQPLAPPQLYGLDLPPTAERAMGTYKRLRKGAAVTRVVADEAALPRTSPPLQPPPAAAPLFVSASRQPRRGVKSSTVVVSGGGASETGVPPSKASLAPFLVRTARER